MNKKLVFVFVAIVLAILSVAFVFVSNTDSGTEECKTEGAVTTCMYEGGLDLVSGCYSLPVAVGFSRVVNTDGTILIRYIKINRNIEGSLDTSTGEIYGFRLIKRIDGDVVYCR